MRAARLLGTPEYKIKRIVKIESRYGVLFFSVWCKVGRL